MRLLTPNFQNGILKAPVTQRVSVKLQTKQKEMITGMENNQLKNCKVCGAEVAKSAKTCPHCGAKLKKGHPILVGILVFVVLIAVIGSFGSNDEPQKVEASASAQSTAPTQETEALSQKSETPSSEAAKEPEKEEGNRFCVGETAELKGVDVTLVGVTESRGSTYNTPSDGNVFVLCEFEIVNDSSKEISVSSIMSFEAYCDDYTCTFSLGALMEKGNKNQLDGTVAAGKKFNGVVGYEIPNDWKELEIVFTPDFWSGKDITFIATND